MRRRTHLDSSRKVTDDGTDEAKDERGRSSDVSRSGSDLEGERESKLPHRRELNRNEARTATRPVIAPEQNPTALHFRSRR